MEIKEFKSSIKNLSNANEILISQIDEVFKFRSEEENKKYLQSIIFEFDELQSLPTKNKSSSEFLVELNLNNQLLLKNLLLTQSKKVMDKLLSTNDSAIVNQVYEYKGIKSRLHKIYSNGFSEATDELKIELNRKEKELIKLEFS